MESTHIAPVRSEIQALVKCFQLINGELLLSKQDFLYWHNFFSYEELHNPKELAQHLIALALRFQKIDPEKTHLAIEQISNLAAILLTSQKETDQNKRKNISSYLSEQKSDHHKRTSSFTNKQSHKVTIH